MDHLILGIRDQKTRECLISQKNLDLKRAIFLCKSMEATQEQMKALGVTDGAQDIHAVKTYKKKYSSATATKPTRSSTPKKCKFCSRVHIMQKTACPAWGKTCDVCHQENHFKGSEACRKCCDKSKRRVHVVRDEEYDSDSSTADAVISIHTVTADINSVISNGAIFCEMMIDSKPVKLQIDSGATVNVIMKELVPNVSLLPSHVILRMWNGSTIKALGKCKVKTTNPKSGKTYNVHYVVVDQLFTPLLSRNAAEKMELITLNYDNFEAINAQSSSGEDFLKKQPAVFDDGLGTLPGGKVHLTCEPGSTGSIRPARTLPEALKTPVRTELNRMVAAEILEKVEEPSDWVKQMSVATKKSGAVRICSDPRDLNLHLKREHYNLPVLDDVLPELANSTIFSVCDLKQGYLHCELDEESKLLTTFATPFGR